MRRRATPPRRPAGLVLLALLLMLMLAAIALNAAADVWNTTRRREQERELLFIGEQYRQALRHYYLGAPPGMARVLPTRLEELLSDERYPVPVRHLRRLYPDPIGGGTDWGLVKLGDRISGVYSPSDAEPLKQAGFTPAQASFENKTAYHDWIFEFVPPRTARR